MIVQKFIIYSHAIVEKLITWWISVVQHEIHIHGGLFGIYSNKLSLYCDSINPGKQSEVI